MLLQRSALARASMPRPTLSVGSPPRMNRNQGFLLSIGIAIRPWSSAHGQRLLRELVLANRCVLGCNDEIKRSQENTSRDALKLKLANWQGSAEPRAGDLQSPQKLPQVELDRAGAPKNFSKVRFADLTTRSILTDCGQFNHCPDDDEVNVIAKSGEELSECLARRLTHVFRH